MEAHLNKINEIIEKYNNIVIADGNTLSHLLRELTCQLFFLEGHRIEAHNKFNNVMFNRGKDSVSGATIKANNEVPELYKLRHVITSAYKVVDALRS